jgi:putative spermidine/putrescine transport system ATP-binding protein/spermidine/putrescine transport system ATP-binding protein
MQVELKVIQRETGVTTIFVTHDQEEALTLSDRVAIIDRGKLVQIGAPRDVYERPATLFAARFLGDANVFTGERSDRMLVLADGSRIQASGAGSTVIVRPEKMLIFGDHETSPPELQNRLSGKIVQSIYSGASVTYHIAVPASPGSALLAFIQNREGEVLPPGSPVLLAWSPEHTVPVAA